MLRREREVRLSEGDRVITRGGIKMRNEHGTKFADFARQILLSTLKITPFPRPFWLPDQYYFETDDETKTYN